MIKYKLHRYEGISKNLNVTHISFDMVNENTKTFYGIAHFINHFNMKDVGRIETIEMTDDDFNKINGLYQRGVNMFSANDNYIFIK
jgi:hypothetical protein